jgi:hypothetical protein
MLMFARVSGDDAGAGGEQVGADQGEVVAGGGAGLTEQDDADLARAERAVAQAGDGGQVHGVGAPVAGHGGLAPGGGGGQVRGGAQPLAFQRRPPGSSGACWGQVVKDRVAL